MYFMYQVSNRSKLLTLIRFRTDNFGKIGRVIIFKMADCTQREFVQINTKINRCPVILFQHNTYEIYPANMPIWVPYGLPIWGVQPGLAWVPYGLAHMLVAQMGPI